MENKYIFYGAGLHARKNLDRWISEGFVPVCFVDSDINKHNKKFGNTEYMVLSLEEAVAKYPDCKFLVTVGNLFRTEIYNLLIDYGIYSQKIKFTENVEFRNGCTFFEETMAFNAYNLCICCYTTYLSSPFDMNSNESLLMAVKKYEENIELLRKKWLNSEETPCNKCPYLKQGIYTTQIKTTSILIGNGFEGSRCNFKCIYCNATEYLANLTNINLYKFITQLSCYIDYQDMIFNFANGEFLFHKDAKKILSFLYGKGAKISITSNSSIYSRTLANFIREGRVVGINTSLDAGTSETFAKVKNVNIEMFNKVVNNILKYSQLTPFPPLYFLKYIMLEEINDNEADINGFADICKLVKPHTVCISADMRIKDRQLSQNAINMIVLLNNKLMQSGFNVVFAETEFNHKDLKIIKNIGKVASISIVGDN